MTGMLPTFDCFNAGAPDHHGLAALCGIYTLLFLIVGQANPAGHDSSKSLAPAPETKTTVLTLLRSQTNLCLVASGVAGGLGLWISAASQILVLGGIGLGATLSILTQRFLAKGEPFIIRNNTWLIWSAAGALTSIAGYAIEYLPTNTAWRLEVNHPLYALAWLGAGWLLTSLSQWAAVDRSVSTRAKLALDGAALIVTLLPLLFILLRGSSCFLVSDPFLWALHKNYIDEFQDVTHIFKSGFHLVPLCGLLPLGLLLLPLFLPNKPTARAILDKTVILTFLPGFFLTLFALRQIRWMGLACALLLVGLMLATGRTWFDRSGPLARRLILIFVAAVFIGQPLRICWALQEDNTIGEVDRMNLRVRDLSHWLRLRAGGEDVVVASSPTLTTPLIFFGGLRGIGTFYWENIEGLKTCSDLFSANSFEEAEHIVRNHHITHIVLASWDSFVREYVSLNDRTIAGKTTPEQAFATCLVKNRSMPPWLRLVPYTLPNLPPASTDEVLIFEVVPEQSPETRLINLAHYFVDMGLPQTARQLLPALEHNPENLHVTIARARIHLALQNRAALDAAIACLPATPPPDAQLDLEEMLHFAALQAIAGHNTQAQQQLLACINRLDAKSVRKLSPSAAYALLALCQQYDLPLTVDIANLAGKLIAPELREQIFGRSGKAQP
jgi:hypothetical protein